MVYQFETIVSGKQKFLGTQYAGDMDFSLYWIHANDVKMVHSRKEIKI